MPSNRTNYERPGHERPGYERPGLSRRAVLTVATVGAGAAAAGVAGLAIASTDEEEAVSGTLVVHVRDAAAGRLDVFVGTERIEVHDKKLAATLVKLAR